MFALLLTVSWVMGGVGWGEGVEQRTSHHGDRKEPGFAIGREAGHCLPVISSDESACGLKCSSSGVLAVTPRGVFTLIFQAFPNPVWLTIKTHQYKCSGSWQASRSETPKEREQMWLT